MGIYTLMAQNNLIGKYSDNPSVTFLSGLFNCEHSLPEFPCTNTFPIVKFIEAMMKVIFLIICLLLILVAAGAHTPYVLLTQNNTQFYVRF